VHFVDHDQVDADVGGGDADGVDDSVRLARFVRGRPRKRANSTASMRGVAAGGTVT